MTRTQADLEAAARRVHAEGRISASKAAKLCDVSPATIVSWITAGRQGVYLDGAKAGGGGWWTSERALFRFSGERALRIVARPRLVGPVEKDRRADEAGERLAALVGRA